MATKQVKFPYPTTGLTNYIRFQNESGNYYDDGDGTFKAYAEANVVAMTEHVDQKQLYEWEGGGGGGAKVWPDGLYYGYIYQQVGGAPDDDNDQVIGEVLIPIVGDAEVSHDILGGDLKLLKALSSKNNKMFDTSYDGDGNLTAATIRGYGSKADLEGDTNHIFELTLVATYSGAGLATTHEMKDSS